MGVRVGLENGFTSVKPDFRMLNCMGTGTGVVAVFVRQTASGDWDKVSQTGTGQY